MTPATPRRRYPASLSHNPAGPSRPATRAPRASVDDKAPDVAPAPVPELASLEHLLQQAGYKETRVFTPEAERARPRLREFDDDEDNAAAELVDLYRSMGLDPNAPIHVRHLTKPSVPFRSSSSVLRNIALQDATVKTESSPELKQSWWGTTLLKNAAVTVGKSISAMSPPSDGPSDTLAKGNPVRKAKSNWELRSTQEDTLKKSRVEFTEFPEWNCAPPPSLAGLFSPPRESAGPLSRFGDELEHSEGEDMFAYGMGSDGEVQTDSAGSSLSQDTPVFARPVSPPLLDTEDVFADLGLTGPDPHRAEIAAVGRRILASTIEYDDADDLDTPPTPTTPSPVIPILAIQQPTPEQTSKRVKEAITAERIAEAMAEATPTKVAPKPQQRAANLRAAKSTPALSPGATRHRPPLLRITPVTAAPPTVQTASPIICDSVSNAAEDLPPLPLPPMPESPPPTGSFSTLTLRARKSLSALRAYLAAEPAAEPESVPSADDLPISSTTPILTPRIDWEAQAFTAGWNTFKHTHKSRDSTDTMAELGDPFLDITSDIDYTKSFFYKPSTPPKAGAGTMRSHLEPRRQRSIKSLRAALRIPVAPPVPPIPEKYKKGSASSEASRTPPIPTTRLAAEAPIICVHSPGAYEEGREARPLILEGAEWEGRDTIKNWGKGVRKGKGKKRVGGPRGRMSYDCYDWN